MGRMLETSLVRTWRLTAVLLGVALVLGGCPRKLRVKGDLSAPSQTTGEAAKKAQVVARDAVLPPPTMSPREVRGALWDIAARQRKGEAGKALNDYADRYEGSKTLEARFLAASAIPDLDEQWNAISKISSDQPRFYWAHIQIASIYAQWKVRDQCEKEVNLALQFGPEIPYSYTVRGNLYRTLGAWPLAVRDYATALRADPGDADARVGLVLARKGMGNLEGYEASMKKALGDLPTQYEAAEALALLYDEQNAVAEARLAWQNVAELMPKNRSAKLALARLAGDQDPTSAITAYEQAGKLQALTKVEQQALARLYQQVSRTDDEIKALQALVKLDAKDAVPWRRLATIYEGKADLPNMESTYNSLRALDGKDTQALMGLARVAEKRAQIRAALELFREALAAGEPTAQSDIQRLGEACLMPVKPLAGSTLTYFYRNVLDSLEKIFNKRLADAPAMRGTLKAKIVSDGEGKALSVDVVENTTSDPYLEAHLYYALLEATWPKLKPTDKKSFTLKFDLPPEKH